MPEIENLCWSIAHSTDHSIHIILYIKISHKCCFTDMFSVSSIPESVTGLHNDKKTIATDLSCSNQQVMITEIESTKYIHVRQNGTSVRVFKETSV